MTLPTDIKNYLTKFGINGWSVTSFEKKYYNNIIVIPALNEFENIKLLLASISECDNKYFDETLILFVVNNKKTASKEEKQNNAATINYLASLQESNSSTSLPNISFIDVSSTSKEMDDKIGGVGLARKIGMDLALQKYDYTNNKKKLLICLDSDCKVEANYLTQIVDSFNNKNLFAGYVQFEHQWDKDDENTKAIICYEIFLNYYVLGLKYSDSPYAFHTIGSTIVCSHDAYIKVQGMNKRKAGEDFYFLEKLSKHFPIEKIESTKVFPSSRTSGRVPFGTGQRITRHLSGLKDEYTLYSPAIFDILKKWHQIFFKGERIHPELVLNEAENIDNKLHLFLIDNDFIKSYRNILENSKDLLQLSKQKLYWFDAFKTLKLIHFLRDEKFPDINMFDAVDDMLIKLKINPPLQHDKNSILDLADQIKYLHFIRSLT